MTRRNIFRTFIGIALTRFTHAQPERMTSCNPGPSGVPADAIKTPLLSPELDIPEWLLQWQREPMIPIMEGRNPCEIILLIYQTLNNPITIRYANSSDGSNTPRSVTPILLFEKENYPDSSYLLAWCHSRNSPRVFKTTHITLQDYE